MIMPLPDMDIGSYLGLAFTLPALLGYPAFATDKLDRNVVYNVTPINNLQQEAIRNQRTNKGFYFFVHPRALNASSRVMVPSHNQSEFEHRQAQTYNVKTAAGFSFSAFQRHYEINNYLDELALKYPYRVSVKTIGSSYEGRAMKTITITDDKEAPYRKIIFVDGGIHGREWIAPAVALYVINQLVENYSQNRDLLATYDWVVLPVVNPDGYEYSHTENRLWRKTRKPVSNSCYGVDANRNFDFHWGEVGASSYSCSDSFRGKKPFSEPETRALRDALLSLGSRVKFYLTLHSYGNYLLYPWGWTSSLPSTVADLDEVAQAGAAAIEAATGTKYTVGSSTNVLYAASGSSYDWAFGVAKIPISITMELPAGGSGFDPLPSEITPLITETWIGIRAMATSVIAKY